MPRPKREISADRIDPRTIRRVGTGWAVPSATSDQEYRVELNDDDRRASPDVPWWERLPQCTCLDNHIRHVRCKHIAAVFRVAEVEEAERERLEMEALIRDAIRPPQETFWCARHDRREPLLHYWDAGCYGVGDCRQELPPSPDATDTPAQPQEAVWAALSSMGKELAALKRQPAQRPAQAPPHRGGIDLPEEGA